MRLSHHDQTPPDLLGTVELLRQQRPEATPLELDRIKMQSKARAARRSPSFSPQQKGLFMRSRIAITSMLVVGTFMSGTGASLAVSGISASGNAAAFAYPEPVKTTQDIAPATTTTTATPPAAAQSTPPAPATTVTPAPTVLGEVGKGTETPAAPAAGKGVSPGGGGVEDVSAQEAQPARQVAAQGEATLPFTGFAAIPVMLAGLALLAAGFVLRRPGRDLA